MSEQMTLEQVREEISDHLSDGNSSSPSDETLHDWIDAIDAHLNAAAPDLLNALTVLEKVASSMGIPTDAARRHRQSHRRIS